MLPLMMMSAVVAASAEPERLDLALTIYSSAAPGALSVDALAQGALPNGYGVIRDTRKLDFPKGTGEIRFRDVAARMDPTTVSFLALDQPDGARVLEQNFQFDLVSAAKLLRKHIDQEVRVTVLEGQQSSEIEGQLLAVEDGLTLADRDGRIRFLKQYSQVSFPALPGGLITRPTLVWLLSSKQAGAQRAQVSYQSSGFAWWTDYNVTLEGDGQKCQMNLGAWVTLVNRSGASYPNTILKLVAGEPNRAPAAQPATMMRSMAKMEMADGGMQESELFEYHLYTLGRRTDLPDQSTKQLELFPAVAGIGCQRQLIFSAGHGSTMYWGGPNLERALTSTSKGNAQAFLEFANSKEQGLGIPMPAGRVRVSQAGSDGALEFIGEDVIKHTPRNETLTLRLGEAFDIAGERSQLDFALNEGGKTMRETVEIKVRNRKRVEADIIVREWLYRWSAWEIQAPTHAFKKRDASTIDFPVKVPADGEVTVRYTVEYRW
jgi:hypothetical protein